MKPKLRRSLAVVAVVGGLAAALTGSAGAEPTNTADGPSERVGEELLRDCLNDPNFPAENVVLKLDKTSDGGPVSLLCGNEAYGARHIHGGHFINNPRTFANCWFFTLGLGSTEPGNDPNGSTLWRWPYAPGKEGNVVVDNADRDTLTAYTSGPNSADWDACGAER